MAYEVPDVGTLIFGGLVTYNLICAGVASAAPARHPSIGWGGVIVSASWVAAVLNLLGNSSRFAAIEVVLVDMATLAAFFALSRRTTADQGAGFFCRDWAAYAVIVMAAIILLEVFNLILLRAGDWRAHALAAILSSAGFFAFGLLRGYGLKLFFTAIIIVGAFLAAAAFTYVRSVNFLTLILFMIVAAVATRAANQNIRAWSKQFRDQTGAFLNRFRD